MFKRIYLTTFLGLAISTLAAAQEVDTQNTAIATNLGLYGGQAADIAPDPLSDTVYVANGAPNGLFVSTDLGDSWTGLPSDVNYGTGKEVTVDPDSGTAFAIIGDTLLHTTDTGTTWEDITANVDESIGNGLIAAHGRLLLGMAGGVIAVSTDGGDTFTLATIDSTATIVFLAASPDTDVFYALVTDNTDADVLYRSTDGGENWTDLAVTSNGMATGTSIWKVAVNPTNGDNLATTSGVATSTNYITTDGGNNWTAIDNGSGLTFDADGRLYVGFSYTDDPTASSPTWEVYSSNTPLSSIYADQIAVEPENTDVVYNNSAMGLAVSTNRTATWADSVNGVTSVKVYDISQTDDKTVVWLGANGGYAKTENFTDDEPTWEYPVLPAQGISELYAVWVNPDDANTVVAGMGNSMFSYSVDGGETWTQATAPEFGGRVYEILQSRVDTNTLYAAIGNYDLTGADTGAVFKSEDLGVTWTNLGFTDDLPATCMTIASDDTLYVGVDGDASAPGVYMYDGSSWSALSGAIAGKTITSVLVHPGNDDTMFATIPTGLYQSTDGGDKWFRVTSGLEDADNLDTLAAQTTTSPITLYVTGQDVSLNGMVYKSSDGGATWGEYYEGLKQEQFYAMFFDGLIAGNDRGVFDIKSRAKLKLTEKNAKHLAVSLRDAATAKKLKHKAVRIYRKSNGKWNKIKTVHTNTKGKTTVTIKAPADTKFKATWKPSAKDRREYSKATSKVLELNS